MRLLVAALPAELVAFDGELEGFEVLVTGPGKLNAGVALAERLSDAARERPDEIVVVGTAGSVDDALAGGVHDVSATVQHDVTDLEGTPGRHLALPARLEIGGNGPVIATGDSFVDNAETAALIRSLGASLVDMETYALVWVAARHDVPIRVLRAISDRAQDGATELWDEVVATCSGWLRERVREDYGV